MIKGSLSFNEKEFSALVLTPATRQRILEAVGVYMGVAAESVVSEYPLQSRKPLAVFYTRTAADGRTFKSKFKTLKQQRKVFALIRQGKIPYTRTGTLGRSITSSVKQVTPEYVNVAVGTAIQYAPFVIGNPPLQSHYHQGNWTPLESDLKTHETRILQAARKEFFRQLSRLST